MSKAMLHTEPMPALNCYTAQCALPLNLANEKFFVLFWFWLMVLMLATTCSLVWWCYVLLPHNRKEVGFDWLDLAQLESW